MKKLLAVSTFIILGSMAFAQTPVKPQAATPVAPGSAQVSVVPPVEAAPAVDAQSPSAKAESKKECSSAEKKACGTKNGKKSCCSGKAEATKTETK